MRALFYILLTLNYCFLCAQDITLALEKKQIRVNERLALQIQFPKHSKREYKAFQKYTFPDIPDFAKENTLFGENETGSFITQYYSPITSGTFTINGFDVRLKKKTVRFKTTEVLVKPGKKALSPPPPQDLEFTYKNPDAFLEVKTSHREVFQGQGLGLQVSLMIAQENETEITFFQLTRQRQEILQRLKSSNCLAEENPVYQITIDSTEVKGKKYNRWKFCELILFPMDSVSLKIPSLGLEVLTYETARYSEGVERKTVHKRFVSAPQKIILKALPIAAVSLPVGTFSIKENISSVKFKTGKSFTYTMVVAGEGNINVLREPIVRAGDVLDVYPPRENREFVIQNGRLFGSRTYTYYITPKEPGDYLLSDFIYFPYFNVEKKRIDTLCSKIPMKIKGESLKNTYISTNHPDDFYSSALSASNALTSLSKEDPLAFYANILILMMLVLTGVIIIKK